MSASEVAKDTIESKSSLKKLFAVSSLLPSDVNLSHKCLHLCCDRLWIKYTGHNSVSPLQPSCYTLLQIIYNQIHIVQFICTPTFPQQHYTAHKFKRTLPPPLQMQNRHPKNHLYQILLIFCVYPPPQVMSLTPVLVLLLFNFLPVILLIIRNHEILLHL